MTDPESAGNFIVSIQYLNVRGGTGTIGPISGALASTNTTFQGTVPVTGLVRLCLLFDGACRFCSRQVRMLERLDRGRGLIRFEDIAAPGFDPAAYGLDAEQMMSRQAGACPTDRCGIS